MERENFHRCMEMGKSWYFDENNFLHVYDNTDICGGQNNGYKNAKAKKLEVNFIPLMN